MFSNICIVGLGYIGLPTAAVIASRGISVIGVDVNPNVVDTINLGKVHIIEPFLDMAVKRSVSSGFLRAVMTPQPADAFVIAVPTPITKSKTADMSYVDTAAISVAAVLKPGDLVILESTSPMGTTEALTARMAAARPDLRFPRRGEDGAAVDVHVAYCPERVLPGKVVDELVSNDRAIGGMTPACSERAAALYRLFVKGELIPTDARSAELCKLAENAFRDVNIAYANELANVCEGMDMNVWEVIRLANRHPRVNILNPGPGVGGHCIAVDPWFIAEAAPSDTPVIQAARRVNDARPQRVVDKVLAAIAEHSKGQEAVVACLGLAFKPDIDDLRESPSMEVVERLMAQTANPLLVVEPNISALPQRLAGERASLAGTDVALAQADILVLLVDHREFRMLDRRGIGNRPLVDTRGLWV